MSSWRLGIAWTRRSALTGIVLLAVSLAACQRISIPGILSEDQAPTAPPPPEEQAPEPPQAAVEPAFETPPPPEPPEEEFRLAALPPDEPLITQPALPGATRVGILLPLSGRFAPEGRAMLNAAQLALFDVASNQFMLLPRDTAGTAAGAANATTALLADGVDLVLGPLFSEEVAAVTPLTQARGVNVIAFSTDTGVAGNGVYLMGHTSRQQVRRLVNHALGAGLPRIALLAPDTPYGRDVARELHLATAELGGAVVRTMYYAPDASNANEVVRALADYDARREALEFERRALRERDDEVSQRALKRLSTLDTLGELTFDALLLPDGGARLRQVVPLLPYYDIDPTKIRLMGTGLWEDPHTLSEPTLAGGWFVGPPAEARAGFERRFTDTYGETPHRLATMAYDATALAAALSAAGAGFDRRTLGNARGFAGTDGVFRFDARGLPERGLAVYEISARGAALIVGPPPTRFPTAARAESDEIEFETIIVE